MNATRERVILLKAIRAAFLGDPSARLKALDDALLELLAEFPEAVLEARKAGTP